MNREIDWIVIHCSATRPNFDADVTWITRLHQRPPRQWRTIGYHLVIKRDGTIEQGRDFDQVGAHVRGHNSKSIGVCLAGGVGMDGKTPEANFTPEQLEALQTWLSEVAGERWPDAQVVGHRDLASEDLDDDGVLDHTEWVKACPSFDVAYWLKTGECVLEAPRAAK